MLEDANPAAVVPGLLQAGLINSGQACAAQTRLLLPRTRYQEYVGADMRLKEEIDAGKILTDDEYQERRGRSSASTSSTRRN